MLSLALSQDNVEVLFHNPMFLKFRQAPAIQTLQVQSFLLEARQVLSTCHKAFLGFSLFPYFLSP